MVPNSMRFPNATAFRIVLLLAAITIVSQFYRVSNGVIGPELVRDLGLTPETLGLTGGAFFLALTVMQIPVGMLFDKYGPRRTIGALTGFAVVGTVLQALAVSPEALFIARFVIGMGCAASFMGAVLLSSRWFAADRYTTVLSWIFALSNLGTLLGSTPLASASEAFGWRWALAGSGIVTALIGLVFFLGIRDWPPDRHAKKSAKQGTRQIVLGFKEVIRITGVWRVFAMHLFVYASMVTVLGVWTGPYLHDVYELDAVTRGRIHLMMGAAQIAGILCYGPLDRIFNSRKVVILGGTFLTVVCFAALGVLPALPVWLAVVLLILLCFVDAFGIVIVAHGRSLFPDDLAGRGVTTINLAQAVGTAFLPVATGFLISGFGILPDGGTSPDGYRAAFLFMGGCLVCGAAVYAGITDSKPRG